MFTYTYKYTHYTHIYNVNKLFLDAINHNYSVWLSPNTYICIFSSEMQEKCQDWINICYSVVEKDFVTFLDYITQTLLSQLTFVGDRRKCVCDGLEVFIVQKCHLWKSNNDKIQTCGVMAHYFRLNNILHRRRLQAQQGQLGLQAQTSHLDVWIWCWLCVSARKHGQTLQTV